MVGVKVNDVDLQRWKGRGCEAADEHESSKQAEMTVGLVLPVEAETQAAVRFPAQLRVSSQKS